MRKVTVQYVFEGKIDPNENEVGVLFGDKVLVTGGQVSVYKAAATADPNVYTVNLDADSTDYMYVNPSLLIDLLVA
ncbi:hypothetical protein [Cytobacillus praedii]|uniref:hypothetical protein n=1 Tax=Cytobacillus praedii TaxID=1742358 RepID=UPI0007100403|nr:hypothetical protein [Cytobacillus praedii]